MNWHDTISFIQKSDIHKDLVLDTFISSDFNLNIKRYSESQEFKEIKEIISKIYSGRKIKILDVREATQYDKEQAQLDFLRSKA